MTDNPLGVAILGCGNIAEPYAYNLARYPEIKLIGMSDIDPARAEALAAKFDAKAYASMDEMLADDAVEIVVNLTIHHAHYETTTRCLKAGKHVHSEKPLALTYTEAQELVLLAEQQGVRLGCSPHTFIGEAQQTAWKQIRDGKLGEVRIAYAEVNWGRIESWHPAPVPFYQVGALYDVGVYPLTMLTAFFGPARRAIGYARTLYPDRQTKDGTPFHIEAPDFVLGIVELASGVVIRLTTDFYVSNTTSHQTGIELHGDLGSLWMDDWQNANALVEFGPFDEAMEPVPFIKPPHDGPSPVEWGLPVREMAQAIIEGRPHRVTGAQAAHVVEILEAITASVQQRGQPIEINSSFEPPQPMDWAV